MQNQETCSPTKQNILIFVGTYATMHYLLLVKICFIYLLRRTSSEYTENYQNCVVNYLAVLILDLFLSRTFIRWAISIANDYYSVPVILNFHTTLMINIHLKRLGQIQIKNPQSDLRNS